MRFLKRQITSVIEDDGARRGSGLRAGEGPGRGQGGEGDADTQTGG